MDFLLGGFVFQRRLASFDGADRAQHVLEDFVGSKSIALKRDVVDVTADQDQVFAVDGDGLFAQR